MLRESPLVVALRVLFLHLPFMLVAPGIAHGQSADDTVRADRSRLLRLYVDCGGCDLDYMKTEIPYVNYVRDRKDAQVYILVTGQSTASEGTEYTATMYGLDEFAGMTDTVLFVARQFDTRDDIRRGLTHIIQLGLVRYIARLPGAEKVRVSYTEELEPTVHTDAWDSWIFNIGMHSFFHGEQSTGSVSIGGSLSANRITTDWKVRMSLDARYNENRFIIGEDKILSISRNQDANVLIARSLGGHWSIGGWGSWSTSTYRNLSSKINLSPAVEFNVFPYDESTQRQFRFLYRIGCELVRYNEETIYGKEKENLFRQSITTALEIKQPWGTVSATLAGSNYIHDIKKHSYSFSCALSLPVVKGLSVDFYGNYSVIHDQLSLQKGDASSEEILLQRRQLETQYSYFGSFGLSYTFGSIYSNVVNPRFGD